MHQPLVALGMRVGKVHLREHLGKLCRLHPIVAPHIVQLHLTPNKEACGGGGGGGGSYTKSGISYIAVTGLDYPTRVNDAAAMIPHNAPS